MTSKRRSEQSGLMGTADIKAMWSAIMSWAEGVEMSTLYLPRSGI